MATTMNFLIFDSNRLSKARKSHQQGDTAEAVGELIGTVVGGIASVFLSAWILMLIGGALAIEAGWSTAIGYKVALLLVVGLSTVGSSLGIRSSGNSKN